MYTFQYMCAEEGFILNHIPTYIFCLFVFPDRVSLYSPGCPGTHPVDQAAGLKLRNLPASTSQVLGLKAYVTTAWQKEPLS